VRSIVTDSLVRLILMECRLEDDGMVTRCEMTTYEPELLMALTFDDRAKVQKVIMKVRFIDFIRVIDADSALTCDFANDSPNG
jgi:hypothetical protein